MSNTCTPCAQTETYRYWECLDSVQWNTVYWTTLTVCIWNENLGTSQIHNTQVISIVFNVNTKGEVLSRLNNFIINDDGKGNYSTIHSSCEDHCVVAEYEIGTSWRVMEGGNWLSTGSRNSLAQKYLFTAVVRNTTLQYYIMCSDIEKGLSINYWHSPRALPSRVSTKTVKGKLWFWIDSTVMTVLEFTPSDTV